MANLYPTTPPGYQPAPPWLPTIPEFPYIPGGTYKSGGNYTPPSPSPYGGAQSHQQVRSMMPDNVFMSPYARYGSNGNIVWPGGGYNAQSNSFYSPNGSMSLSQYINQSGQPPAFQQQRATPTAAAPNPDYLAHLRAIQQHMGGTLAPQYSQSVPTPGASDTPTVAGLNQYGSQLGGGMAKPYYARNYGGATQGLNYGNSSAYGRFV